MPNKQLKVFPLWRALKKGTHVVGWCAMVIFCDVTKNKVTNYRASTLRVGLAIICLRIDALFGQKLVHRR